MKTWMTGMFALSLIVASCQKSNSSTKNEPNSEQSEIAKEAALTLYNANAESVQASDPYAAIDSQSEKNGITTYVVAIQDGNEDGETWTMELEVDIVNDGNFVKGIRHQDEAYAEASLPEDPEDYKAAAANLARALYETNYSGVQGGTPVESEVTIVSSNEYTSIYRLTIYNESDEGEVFEAVYTVEIANALLFLDGITEGIVEN
jgi:hypothetical protein